MWLQVRMDKVWKDPAPLSSSSHKWPASKRFVTCLSRPRTIRSSVVWPPRGKYFRNGRTEQRQSEKYLESISSRKSGKTDIDWRRDRLAQKSNNGDSRVVSGIRFDKTLFQLNIQSFVCDNALVGFKPHRHRVCAFHEERTCNYNHQSFQHREAFDGLNLGKIWNEAYNQNSEGIPT